MEALIIYHANCADGFTSAWIAESVLSQDVDTVLHPASYGDAAPLDIISNDTAVYIVDFSYPADVMKQICDYAHHVVLLDHHLTAWENLGQFHHPDLVKIIDMNLSGAGLTWNWFHPKRPMPDLIRVVQDRDLWAFKYAETRYAMDYIFSFSYTMENWDTLAKLSMEEMAESGAAISQYRDKCLREFLATNTFFISIGDYYVPCANVPYFWASEGGHKLLEMYPDARFACTYFQQSADVRVFSFRSEESRVNVAHIAKLLGGGGHRNAAGAKIKLTGEDSLIMQDGVSLHLPGGIVFEEDEED